MASSSGVRPNYSLPLICSSDSSMRYPRMGISYALERKLKDLEQRQSGLRCELASAEKIMELPDISVIADHWTAVVERLGDLPKTLTPSELDTVRAP